MITKKEIVVSGIRPTGNLHLGNYFGAMKNFIRMQEEYNCFFFIADYHSLTTHPKAEHLHENVKQVMAEYLACGLDPQKCILYIQSDVPEITELYLILNMFAHVGELERSTSYKEKVEKHQQNINSGLLTYPVLMAADILIHKAAKVPVGKDQKQHLEMARTFGNRFNHLYETDFFPEPVAFNFTDELVKIPGLDGSGKMGKSESEGNAVFLIDEPEDIRKKVMRAVTDTGPTQNNQQKPEMIQNLFTLLNVVSDPNTVKHFDELYNNCTIRYGDLKKQLAEDIIQFTTPIREKVKDIASNAKYLHEVVEQGKYKSRQSAIKTIEEIKAIIGIKGF